MPIHPEGYRPFTGSRAAPGLGWRVIARAGIRSFVSRRLFLGFLLLAWLPPIVRAVQIYASVNFAQASFLDISARTFRDFLEQQSLFVFFIAVWVGAGLIANDLRSNALPIYLSKPITRLEYVAGKLAVLIAFLLLVTWAPSMLLLLVQILFSGSLTFVAEHLFLIPAITLASLLTVLVSAFTILALSSFSTSARFVAMTYTGLLFFTEALVGVLRGVTGHTWMAGFSPSNSLEQLTDVMFRQPIPFDTPILGSLGVVVALLVASGFVLSRRVRAVEVVT